MNNVAVVPIPRNFDVECTSGCGRFSSSDGVYIYVNTVPFAQFPGEDYELSTEKSEKFSSIDVSEKNVKYVAVVRIPRNFDVVYTASRDSSWNDGYAENVHTVFLVPIRVDNHGLST